MEKNGESFGSEVTGHALDPEIAPPLHTRDKEWELGATGEAGRPEVESTDDINVLPLSPWNPTTWSGVIEQNYENQVYVKEASARNGRRCVELEERKMYEHFKINL